MKEILLAVKAAAAKATAPATDSLGLSVSAIFTAIAAALGQIPILLILFMAAVALDYLTGWIKAKYFLRDWNSKTGLQAIIKKIMYFVMIGTAFLIGWGIREMGDTVGVNLE